MPQRRKVKGRIWTIQRLYGLYYWIKFPVSSTLDVVVPQTKIKIPFSAKIETVDKVRLALTH